MYVSVFLQRSLICKLLTALFACVRLLSRVSSHVCLEVVQLREGFCAFATTVWLNGQMDPLVSIEVIVSSKCLSTVRTQICFNVRVHLLVLCKLRWSRKLTLATRTFERFFASVGSHVVHEKRRLSKLSPALCADTGFLARMSRSLMVREVSELPEARVTFLTLVRFLAGVDSHVNIEDFFLREAAAADVA